MDKTKLKSRCYLVILLAVFVAAWQVLADRGMTVSYTHLYKNRVRIVCFLVVAQEVNYR